MLRIAQGLDNFNNPMIDGIQQSDTIYAIVMVASTAQYITVPSTANFVLMAASGAADFHMLLGATSGLTVPSANNVAGTAPELIPGQAGMVLRQLKGAGTIGLIATAACNITLAFYQ
jgi:hypothetical protein